MELLALQISNETVPDLETANTEFDKIWDLIFSSEITSTLFKIDAFYIYHCI